MKIIGKKLPTSDGILVLCSLTMIRSLNILDVVIISLLSLMRILFSYSVDKMLEELITNFVLFIVSVEIKHH